MSDLSFQQKYEKVLLKNNSLLCIGLDTEYDKIPFSLKVKPETAIIEFNKAIIQATNQLVCAYKINPAFYLSQGENGVKQLKDTCDLLKYSYPDIISILDIKVGDTAYTNEQLIKFAYDYLGVDAITIQSYLGRESLAPFLAIPNKGNFILCRTPNPGAGEFQDMLVENQPLYQKVAIKVTEWNENNNCMLIVGSQIAQEVTDIRKLVGDKMILFIPGIGTKKSDLFRIVNAAKNSKMDGFIISASRSIIHLSTDSDFFIKAKEAAEKLKNDINAYRMGQHTEEEKAEEEKEKEEQQKQAEQQKQQTQTTQQPQPAQDEQKPLTGAQTVLQQLAQSQKEDKAKEVAEAEKAKEEEKANPFGKPFLKAQISPLVSNEAPVQKQEPTPAQPPAGQPTIPQSPDQPKEGEKKPSQDWTE